MYFESTTRTEPSTHSAQDSVESAKQPEIGRGEGMSKPEVIRERKVDSEEKSSAVIEVPVEWHEGVALGYSGEELRKANEVRGMMPLEQGQELSSLRGVYGFVHYLRLIGRLGVEDDFDSPVNRLPNRTSVEVHKTSGGDVGCMALRAHQPDRLRSTNGKRPTRPHQSQLTSIVTIVLLLMVRPRA